MDRDRCGLAPIHATTLRAGGAQLLTMDFRRFIHALILIPTQIKTGGRRLTFRILSYTRWVRLILGGSQRLRQLQLA